MEPPQRTSDGPAYRQSGSKRLKIDVACHHCRVKKVKCDGVRPVTYTQGRVLAAKETNSNKSTSGVQDAQRNHASISTIQDAPSRRRPVNQPQPHHLSPAASTPGSRRSDIHKQRSTDASMPSNSPSGVDSMTAVVDEGSSTGEFFGKSSAGSFTAQIKKAIDMRLGVNSQDHVPRNAQSAEGAVLATSVPSCALSYVLPPRRQADHLMELYWFYVDPLYPFLDTKRWSRAYEAIFAGTTMEMNERVFMATLNIILALSTQLVESQTLAQREQSSEIFFQRAQGLLPMSPWVPGSLELVQCLLVTSQYLQSTYSPHQTWMVIGSAIRMAQGLGLHLPETSSSCSNSEDRELIRRVWHGCVLMDRNPNITAFSHTKGGGYKEKEINSDDETSDGEDDALDRVVQLDRCLSRWESKLPKHLQWDSIESNTDTISQRQVVILRMRFLHARILLLRPILSKFCLSPLPSERPQVSDNLQARVVQQSAMFCVNTAQNMINTLVSHRSLDNTVGLLPAWWYRVYYVYSAATILIAAKLRPDIFSAVAIGQSWGQAISLLKSHEQFGQSARRCVTALHILSAKILQATSRGSPGRETASSHNGPLGQGRQDNEAPLHALPDLEAPCLVQDFESPTPDFSPQDFADFDLNINDMSWLNDIQGVWELLNE
ncbi:hypothetical protein FLONG3_8670 [Fusarium longipes]|uniref:Xylanolytic transcriptional activator regulatory domain-containing protein n=1 Tax=Fusarium longipes TaxID=694270 RepID=A0A395S4H8_9HYPO|nr:hypothetical protein FLONG3_8670 [Fusarium longipes]